MHKKTIVCCSACLGTTPILHHPTCSLYQKSKLSNIELALGSSNTFFFDVAPLLTAGTTMSSNIDFVFVAASSARVPTSSSYEGVPFVWCSVSRDCDTGAKNSQLRTIVFVVSCALGLRQMDSLASKIKTYPSQGLVHRSPFVNKVSRFVSRDPIRLLIQSV